MHRNQKKKNRNPLKIKETGSLPELREGADNGHRQEQTCLQGAKDQDTPASNKSTHRIMRKKTMVLEV
jgi:hypothetical protein